MHYTKQHGSLLHVHHELPGQSPPAQTGLTKRNPSNVPANQTWLPAVGKSELKKDPEHPEQTYEEFLPRARF